MIPPWRSASAAGGVDVITAEEDGQERASDETLLARAASAGRVLCTHDTDFLVIAPQWRTANRTFSGIVYAHQRRLTISDLIEDLSLIAALSDLQDVTNEVIFLPI